MTKATKEDNITGSRVKRDLLEYFLGLTCRHKRVDW